MAVDVFEGRDVTVPAGPVWERLESQLTWHDRKAEHMQLRYKGLKLVQLTAAAAVPVVAAFSLGEAAAAALGGAILVVEGMQQVGQYHRNWVTYRATAEALQREKHLFIAHAGRYARARDPERLLAERVEALVARETSGWAATQDEACRDEDGPDRGG